MIMPSTEIERRLCILREELTTLEGSRPAHSPRVDMEMRIEEIREEIDALEQLLEERSHSHHPTRSRDDH